MQQKLSILPKYLNTLIVYLFQGHILPNGAEVRIAYKYSITPLVEKRSTVPTVHVAHHKTILTIKTGSRRME